MRWEILRIFKDSIAPFDSEINTVAIVGGFAEEPELKYLPSKEFSFFGIDRGNIDKFTHFDLNIPSANKEQFDLVICSQVLEHVYDVKIALENLVDLVKPGGYLWVACPASNYAHGSPDYFSAGYSHQLITQLIKPTGVQIILAENYGSPRMYFYTHAIQYWPTRREYEFPLYLKPSRYFLQQLFWRICAFTKSAKFNSNLHSATETIVFAHKPYFTTAP